MINSNARCLIRHAGETDVHGQPVLGRPFSERCAVVRLRRESQHTTVRADSSASRGHGDEIVASVQILVAATTKAQIGDQITVHGFSVRVGSMNPQFDAVRGTIDHYQITGEAWA